MGPVPETPFMPERRSSWPGLGETPAAGFEVDTDALRSVAAGILDDAAIAVATIPRDQLRNDPHPKEGMNIGDWASARALGALHSTTARDLSALASDATLECVVAANLIATAGGSYDIADDPGWVKDLSQWSQSDDNRFLRGSWDTESKQYHVSVKYPEAHLTTKYIHFFGLIEMDRDHMTHDKEGIRRTLMSANPGPLEEYAHSTGKTAIALGELAATLELRARDLSEAWLGAAADQAQKALWMIHVSLQTLHTVYDELSVHAREGAKILRQAPLGFDAEVPTLSGLHDFFSDADDHAARQFMTNLNKSTENGLLGVAERLPRHIRTKLPGLIPRGRAERYSLT